MKSLEQFIKQKCKFLWNSKKPYELYNLRPYSYPSTDIRLFLTNMNIETDNMITLLKEMTPLLVYIFSCICHCNEGDYDFREMHFKLKFPNAVLTFNDYLNFSGSHFRTPISVIQDNIAELEANGHCMSFLAPFRLELTFEGIVVRIDDDDNDPLDYPGRQYGR